MRPAMSVPATMTTMISVVSRDAMRPPGGLAGESAAPPDGRLESYHAARPLDCADRPGLRRAVDDAARANDEDDSHRGPDVRKRVSIHDHEICRLADRNRSGPIA